MAEWNGKGAIRPPLPLPDDQAGKKSSKQHINTGGRQIMADKNKNKNKDKGKGKNKGRKEEARKSSKSAAKDHSKDSSQSRRKGNGDGRKGRRGGKAARNDGHKPQEKQSSLGGDLAFLAFVIGLPLAIVGGLYYNAAIHQDEAKANLAREKQMAKAGESSKQAASAAGQIAASSSKAAPASHSASSPPAGQNHQPPAIKHKAASSPSGKGTSAPASQHHASSGGQPHWGYDNVKAWGKLSPAFAKCATGRQQSPIDIPPARDMSGPYLQYNYLPSRAEIVNNGHSIQVNLQPGNQLRVNGAVYELKQFHFHTPSENHLGGKSYPMEIHLVHQDAAGQIAVVAIMVEEGEGESAASQFISSLPKPARPGESARIGTRSLDPMDLLPDDRTYVTFSGSLTTPPCSENVGWIVMTTPIKLPRKSIEAIHAIIGKNNRPLQALNGRAIYGGR